MNTLPATVDTGGTPAETATRDLPVTVTERVRGTVGPEKVDRWSGVPPDLTLSRAADEATSGRMLSGALGHGAAR